MGLLIVLIIYGNKDIIIIIVLQTLKSQHSVWFLSIIGWTDTLEMVNGTGKKNRQVFHSTSLAFLKD